MRRPFPPRRSPLLDLIAYIAALATGVTLIALGLSPESLAAVAIALAGLYSAWRMGRPAVDRRAGAAHRERPSHGTNSEHELEHVEREQAGSAQS